MPANKPALGRGLDALFSAPTSSTLPIQAEGPAYRQISIGSITPNPFQPRTEFDDEKLIDLAASIRAKGILQPLLLRRNGSAYELVAGERRWRAAQKAGLHQVPAIVRDYDDQAMMEAALIENIQREDLNAMEEAKAYERLTNEFGLTQETVASGLGKSRVAITNSLRLLKLPRSVQEYIRNSMLSAGHGRAVLALDGADNQLALARRAINDKLSVRQVERLAKAGKSGETNGHRIPLDPVDPLYADVEQQISQKLGLKVRLKPKTNQSGSLEILYTSLDDFGRLTEALGVASGDES